MRIRDMLRASRWIVLAVVLAAAAGATTVYLWRGFERPLPMSADRVEVRIANGASARAIARAIRAAGVDLNELEFVAAVRASGAAPERQTGQRLSFEGDRRPREGPRGSVCARHLPVRSRFQ